MPSATPPVVTGRDLVFAAINGAIFGAGATFILSASPKLALLVPSIGVTMAFFAVLAVVGLGIGALLAHWKPFFLQLAKFGIIGVANTSIDLGIYNMLILASGLNTTTAITEFKVLSFGAAVINSYFWNKYWSFHQNRKATLHEFFQFLAVSLTGMTINAGITWLVINNFKNADGTVGILYSNIGAVAGILLVLMWNFVGYKLIVFKK